MAKCIVDLLSPGTGGLNKSKPNNTTEWSDNSITWEEEEEEVMKTLTVTILGMRNVILFYFLCLSFLAAAPVQEFMGQIGQRNLLGE